MSELSAIYDRLGRIEASVAGMQAHIATFDNLFASQTWVQGKLEPMRASLHELTVAQAQLMRRTEELYAAHEKFLTDEAVRKDEEHRARIAALEKQTLSAVVGNWATVAGWVAAIIAALTVAGPPLLAFLQAVLHVQ